MSVRDGHQTQSGRPIQRVRRTRARASTKVGTGFGVPCSTARAPRGATWQAMGGQRHPAEKAEQDGCGARNGQVRPLPLGLHPQVSTHGWEGDFSLPTAQAPLQHLCLDQDYDHPPQPRDGARHAYGPLSSASERSKEATLARNAIQHAGRGNAPEPGSQNAAGFGYAMRRRSGTVRGHPDHP